MGQQGKEEKHLPTILEKVFEQTNEAKLDRTRKPSHLLLNII